MSQKVKSKKSGSQTIFWWIVWISLTIVSFFAAQAFWTPIIARHFGSIRETKTAVIWVAAVFGTWMIILVPLIVVMYAKVDRAYEDARMAREKAAARFKSISIDRSLRLLPASLRGKLKDYAPIMDGGHLVHLHLKNGARVPNVFISNEEEILGIYQASEMNFKMEDIADLEFADLKGAPPFLANQWLRLDGVLPS